MTHTVRKAIVPAAGRGTRMRPATLAIPKELLALGARPALHLVLEEAVAAGVDQVAIVTRPDKPLIRSYVERLAATDSAFAEVTFTWVQQTVPTGLGDALIACRDFVDDDPFALLLPDNILLSPEYRLRSMLDTFGRFDSDVVGIVAVGHEASGEYGNSGRIDWEPLGERSIRVTRLQPKGQGRMVVGRGEEVLRTCGRYVCMPQLLDDLERLRPPDATDYDEVPAYREVVSGRGLVGYLLPTPLYDVGHPSGFLAACAWLDRQRRETPLA